MRRYNVSLTPTVSNTISLSLPLNQFGEREVQNYDKETPKSDKKLAVSPCFYDRFVFNKSVFIIITRKLFF